MPCRSHDQDPSLHQKHGYRAATLLVWLCDRLQRDAPIWAYAMAKDYRNQDQRPTQALCALLDELGAERLDEVLAMSTGSRGSELAQWWQLHQQADAERDD